MLNTATLISRGNMELARVWPEDVTTPTINKYHEQVVIALGKLEPFATIEKSILANRILSPEGQQQQLLKAATDSLKDWESLGRVLKALELEMSTQRADLFTVEPTITDDQLRYLRAREIRDRMSGLDQSGRDQAYLKASQEDQPEVLLALQDAPGGTWVSADIQRRADVERAKHQKPDLFASFTQNEIFHDRLHGFADHLAQWLRSFGVAPARVATALGLSA